MGEVENVSSDFIAYLKNEILPKLIAQARDRDHTLRFWAAGCATGEEPYSLAMLVTDLLGAELPEWSVKIFATDLDEAAINFAWQGLYSENLLMSMPNDYRDRFFEHVDHGYRISKMLRQMVIFGQQDLSRSAPFPRIDLVLCRNVLIYFTPELQDYVLNQFAFSLSPGGYLFLGKAETVRPNQVYYELVNKHWKVYRCTSNALPATNRASLTDVQVQRSTRRSDQRPSRMMGKQRSEQESLTPSHDLGQLQRLNELLLRYLPVGVLVIDRSYHVLTANGTARRLLGLRDIINEQDFLHAVRGIPYTEVRSAIDAVFRERGIITLPEVELATSTGGNGRFICISIALMQIEAGSLDLAAISVTDVTEQVQVRRQLETVRAEQAQLMNELSSSNKRLNDMNKELMDSNEELRVATERAREVVAERERLRLIFDNANMTALALYDAQTAELIIGSSRYLDLVARAHGIERSELIGRKWQELTFVTPPEQAATIWDTVVGSHVPVRQPEVHYKFAEDGQERVWDWSLTPVIGTEEPDTVRFALVSMIEITEQALARWEMERLNRIKDEFLSLAGHELRTPLSAIKGNAELLQRGLKQQLKARGRGSSDKATRPLDSEQEIHMLERVISQADHMNKLIGEMLDMTRIRADVLELRKKENVNIVELARRTVEQYASITNHPFTLHSSQEAVLGNWDEIRLEQVLDNLISNAVKYSPPGKPVTVSIERRSEPTPEVIVWVRDEGRGISEEEQAHIFDRFYRGRNDEQFRIEGLGLGLYISNEIITRQGGRIWLESKPGEGSTFYVSLPL